MRQPPTATIRKRSRKKLRGGALFKKARDDLKIIIKEEYHGTRASRRDIWDMVGKLTREYHKEKIEEIREEKKIGKKTFWIKYIDEKGEVKQAGIISNSSLQGKVSSPITEEEFGKKMRALKVSPDRDQEAYEVFRQLVEEGVVRKDNQTEMNALIKLVAIYALHNTLYRIKGYTFTPLAIVETKNGYSEPVIIEKEVHFFRNVRIMLKGKEKDYFKKQFGLIKDRRDFEQKRKEFRALLQYVFRGGGNVY